MDSEMDDLVASVEGRVSEHCTHVGYHDGDFPSGCGDCHAIAYRLAETLFAAGYRKTTE